jgi:hypothetical protein
MSVGPHAAELRVLALTLAGMEATHVARRFWYWEQIGISIASGTARTASNRIELRRTGPARAAGLHLPSSEGLPGFVDTEEVTGSNPVSPTKKHQVEGLIGGLSDQALDRLSPRRHRDCERLGVQICYLLNLILPSNSWTPAATKIEPTWSR